MQDNKAEAVKISEDVEVVPDNDGKVKKVLRGVRDWVKDDHIDPTKLHILAGLNKPVRGTYGNKHVYGGTVGSVEKAKRRATNKRARAARRVHRLRSK